MGGNRKKEDRVQKRSRGTGGASHTVQGNCPAGVWIPQPRYYVKIRAEDNDVRVIPTEVKTEAKNELCQLTLYAQKKYSKQKLRNTCVSEQEGER